jgi:hypothetical protein
VYRVRNKPKYHEVDEIMEIILPIGKISVLLQHETAHKQQG